MKNTYYNIAVSLTKKVFTSDLNTVFVWMIMGLFLTAGSSFCCKSQPKEDEDSNAVASDVSPKQTTDTKAYMEKSRDIKSPNKAKAKLEFRIVPSQRELTAAGVNVDQRKEQLEQEGPLKAGTDEYVWQKIRNPRDPGNTDQRGGFPEVNRDGIPLVIGKYLGDKYVLVSNNPEEPMLHETGPGAWKLSNCQPTTNLWGKPAVGFSFNEAGTKQFWDLTKAHKGQLLGIFLDDVALSAPNINTPIFQRGIIMGDFSPQEVHDIVDKLNADIKKENILFKLFK